MPVSKSKVPHTVFVSHAHTDNELCDRLVAALRTRGLDVWYDRTNMQDGHMLNAEIEAQLEARTAFVVLLTPASIASYWVNLEVSAFRSLAAQDPTRLMLPVRIADCKVPLLMAGIKWIDAVGLGFDAAVEATAKALEHHGSGRSGRALIGARRHIQVSSGRNLLIVRLLARGKKLYDQEHFVEASYYFERATQRDPKNVESWWHLAQTHVKQRNWEDAVDALDQLLSLNSRSAEVWILKSKALFELGYFSESLDAAELALDDNPTLAEPWLYKGHALKRLLRYEEALGAYSNALVHDADHAEAWRGQGESLEALGREQEALLAYDKAFELDPDNSEGWSRFQLQFDLDHIRRHVDERNAEECLSHQDGTTATKWAERGEAYSILNRDAEALDAFEHALTLDSRCVRALVGKAIVLFRARFESLRPPSGCFGGAEAGWKERYKLSNYDDAFSAFDQAIAIEPECVEAWFHKGKCLDSLGETTLSNTAFEKVTVLDPWNAGAWWYMCRALGALQRDDEALAAYSKATEIHPGSARLWFQRARLLEQGDRYDEALISYRRAAELHPASSSIWEEIGDTMQRMNRYEEALIAIDHSLALKPGSSDLWRSKEFALRALHRDREASEAAGRFYALEPPDPGY